MGQGLGPCLSPGGDGADDDEESALGKYSKDIVKFARDGKLDPVIGRDEEISRVVSDGELINFNAASLFTVIRWF